MTSSDSVANWDVGLHYIMSMVGLMRQDEELSHTTVKDSVGSTHQKQHGHRQASGLGTAEP